MIILPAKLSEMKDSDSVFFIDLYKLSFPTGNLYMCACDTDISFYIPGTSTPVTYMAQPIERGELTQTSDSKLDNVEIGISDASEAFLNALFDTYDFRGYDIDIYQIAYPGSLGNSDQYKWVFHGYIDSPSLDMSTATFKATLKAYMPNQISCRTFMSPCNAWFGDSEECGAYFDIKSGTVGVNSNQYVIYDPARIESGNYWKNGVITIGFESKRIISSSPGLIVVEYPFYNTPTGTYTIQNGCDHTQTDCIRHNNLLNYSGFPGVPYEYVART
jgi:hypothetical protein